VGGRTHARTDGRTDGWTDGRTDGKYLLNIQGYAFAPWGARIVIAIKMLRRKNLQMEGLKLEKRKAFVQNWYKEQEDQIVPQLGSPADQNRLQFLNGIFFAPLFVKQNRPSTSKSIHGRRMPFTLWKVYVVFVLQNDSEF
jgi:hypothetical protein